MNTQIIKGKDLMLFDGSNSHSFAYATNHTLTLSAELATVSSKDHGMWDGGEVQKFAWEISSENLYTTADFETMFDHWVAGDDITVKFGLKSESLDGIVGESNEYWTLDTSKTYYQGNAIITSLTANANNGDNATYSITLKGVSKFEKHIAQAAAAESEGEPEGSEDPETPVAQ